MQMYSDKLNDHLVNPRNVGELADPSGSADVVNSACGDRMRLSIKVQSDTVIDAKVQAYGCAPTIAVASALTELIIGSKIDDLWQLERAQIAEAVGGLPRKKMHCAALALDALQTAIEDCRKRA